MKCEMGGGTISINFGNFTRTCDQNVIVYAPPCQIISISWTCHFPVKAIGPRQINGPLALSLSQNQFMMKSWSGVGHRISVEIRICLQTGSTFTNHPTTHGGDLMPLVIYQRTRWLAPVSFIMDFFIYLAGLNEMMVGVSWLMIYLVLIWQRQSFNNFPSRGNAHHLVLFYKDGHIKVKFIFSVVGIRAEQLIIYSHLQIHHIPIIFFLVLTQIPTLFLSSTLSDVVQVLEADTGWRESMIVFLSVVDTMGSIMIWLEGGLTVICLNWTWRM